MDQKRWNVLVSRGKNAKEGVDSLTWVLADLFVEVSQLAREDESTPRGYLFAFKEEVGLAMSIGRMYQLRKTAEVFPPHKRESYSFTLCETMRFKPHLIRPDLSYAEAYTLGKRVPDGPLWTSRSPSERAVQHLEWAASLIGGVTKDYRTQTPSRRVLESAGLLELRVNELIQSLDMELKEAA